MSPKKKKLVIIGAGEFAEIAYEYFTYDSDYEVHAFSVERDYLDKPQLFNLPVTAFEEIEQLYSNKEYDAFVAVTSTRLNRVRARLFENARKKGYSLATYISSKAFVWRNVKIGDNCFIFESNVIQHNVEIGNNVVMWSGNHIGHRSKVRDNCFFSSHVVVSGYCEIGDSSFLGVNSTFVDRVRVGKDCLIGAGAVVTRDTESGKIYTGNPAVPSKVSSYMYFGLRGEEQ